AGVGGPLPVPGDPLPDDDRADRQPRARGGAGRGARRWARARPGRRGAGDELMATVWFILLAAMITTYVVLDGFDLGAGAIHLLIGRNEREREALTETYGPVWNGNEVWLIAAGGVLCMT